MNYINDLCNILEDKENNYAGGAYVCMNLSLTASLMIYVCNKTIGKKKYQEYEEYLLEIKKHTLELKNMFIKGILDDKDVLTDMLNDMCEENLIKGVNLSLNIIRDSKNLYEEALLLEKYGNVYLKSDINIIKYNIISSIKSSLENYYINVKDITDKEKYEKTLNDLINDPIFDGIFSI